MSLGLERHVPVAMIQSFRAIAFPKIPHGLEPLPPFETPRASFIPAQGNALGSWPQKPSGALKARLILAPHEAGRWPEDCRRPDAADAKRRSSGRPCTCSRSTLAAAAVAEGSSSLRSSALSLRSSALSLRLGVKNGAFGCDSAALHLCGVTFTAPPWPRTGTCRPGKRRSPFRRSCPCHRRRRLRPGRRGSGGPPGRLAAIRLRARRR